LDVLVLYIKNREIIKQNSNRRRTK